jgi:rod shape-determining protein MreD
MSNYIGIPILLVAALLNSTLMSEFRIGGGAPDLVFMLVVSWALLGDVEEALTWAVIGGVMQDLLSVAPLGTSSLGLVIVAFGADTIFGQIQRSNFIVPPVTAIGGTFVYHLTTVIILGVIGVSIPLGRGLTYVTLPTLFYNALLIIPVFRATGILYRWLHPHRVRIQ